MERLKGKGERLGRKWRNIGGKTDVEGQEMRKGRTKIVKEEEGEKEGAGD